MFFNNRNLYVRLRGAYMISRSGFSGCFTADERRYTSLSLRLSGTTHFDDGKQTYVANAGSIIYLPRSLKFKREGSDEDLYILHLECINNKGEENCGEIELFKPLDPKLYTMHFQRIEESWRAGRTNRASSQLYELFDMMEEEFTHSSAGAGYNMIREGVNYMRMHFQNPTLTVAELAERCHISEVYFRKLYREAFGMSPHGGIAELRFEYAKHLLKSGYYSVNEIAEMSGFSDVKYFRAAFKKRFGISCTEYRISKQKGLSHLHATIP